MSVNSVSGSMQAEVYAAYENKSNTAGKAEEKKTADDTAVVYEKSNDSGKKKGLYTVNKMSPEERKAFVQKLNDDREARKQSLVDLVRGMISKQAKNYSIANDDDSLWKFLAEGDFTVDAETKAKALEDISEDGYWGVKQTSQRLFDFASALAGDDVEKMKKMQKAMQKGYDEATKSWGKDLPGITKDTLDAANKLFEDYYASKEN